MTENYLERHKGECIQKDFRGKIQRIKKHFSIGSINVDCFHLVFWGYTGC